jgi:V8-like Glu-specific endopeptidase
MGMRRLLSAVALTVAISCATLPVAGEGISPVFQIVTYSLSAKRWVERGTGFFVDPDGTGLTNGHLVFTASTQPDKYGLLAIVGQEMFGLSVICATKSDPKGPVTQEELVYGDLARVKVGPVDKPLPRWGFTAPNGVFVEQAHAHEGSMPVFPILPLADAPPSEGDTVTIKGFGHISPIPYEWTATGRVEEVVEMQYHLFSIRSPSPPQPGNSGSPVLNTRGQVVGMFTLAGSVGNPGLSWAQSVSVLKRPCPR